MAVGSGSWLGPYELIALLGAGGMGEVYLAKDSRLDRSVAIKVLSPDLVSQPHFRERFYREGRAISALSHPNVCVLHDVGEEGDVSFLVMEYLDGETLADRIDAGALAARQLLRYAREVASAVDHAHSHGVIHGDLKPSNVMVTASGVKLLDFGIARRLAGRVEGPSVTGVLEGSELTVEGTLVGTVPYMAPEQIEGREADARTDIFAFGAMVYEMATGRRAFEAATQAGLVAAIMGAAPPPLSTLLSDDDSTSALLDHVVTRCLAKDPDERWQTARDLLRELEWIASDRTPASRVKRHFLSKQPATLFAVALISAIGAVMAAGYLRLASPEPMAVSLDFVPPPDLALADLGSGGPVTISPDGRRFAFVATGLDGRQLLWVRSVDDSVAHALPGTDGASYPFWSPDSEWVGFFAQRKLKKSRVTGGSPHVLCNAVQPRGGTWSPDGIIVFASGAGRELYRISAVGGAPTSLPPDPWNPERAWPYFLPDGRHFVYFGRPTQLGIYAASVDFPDARLILRDYVGVAYAREHLFALTGPSPGAMAGRLMALPFDAVHLWATGDPFPVAERVGYRSGQARGAFAVSEAGLLVYGAPEQPLTELVWFGRGGQRIARVRDSAAYARPSLSPDGKTIAVERMDAETHTEDVWLIDAARGLASRFTSHPNFDTVPIWAPDGGSIVFASARGTPPNLFQKASAGASDEELLFTSDLNNQPTDWSRDGRHIVFASLDPKTQWDISVLSLSDGARPSGSITRFLRTEFNEHLGKMSPDSRWLAYVSDETGTNEVYVRAFPTAGVKRRISSGGGSQPRWRGDGRELFYLDRQRRLMSVIVRTEPAFEADTPSMMFDAQIPELDAVARMGYGMHYDVSRDGQRFLMQALIGRSAPARTTVVLNWHALKPR